MDDLKKLLHKECLYRMNDRTMDAFLAPMTEIELKNNEHLIRYGKFDDNVYVVREGILRFAYFDGLKEMTFGFSTPGTVIIQYHSFYRREPSFFQIESCGKSTIMKMSRADYDKLSASSEDFKNWILCLQSAQLWLYERKLAVMNGTARERFDALVRHRPEILEKVSMKVIASYIGITPSSLSRLKRETKKEGK
ncbi:MAG: Crp/Fnr family transcriptional regulator [Alistipes sp.]|jgi:CRP-like cAMP-binding protein|nr:Crp/Fnr family transcriptional regulator [Alistipes sp.]